MALTEIVRLATVSVAVASATLFSSVSAADGWVTGWVVFDVPGAAQGTVPVVVNDLGTVVGSYYDVNNNQHGFARSVDGRVTTIDVPGIGNQTAVQDINDLGTMIGYYTDAAGNVHGWVRSTAGEFAVFDPPNSAGATFPNAINLGGEVVGNYYDASGNDHGFIRSRDGTLTVIDAANPPSGATTLDTRCSHINDEGAIACKTLDSTSTFNEVIRSPAGVYTFVDAPGAGIGGYNGTYGAWEHGLNDLGQMAGTYGDNNGGAHGYVRSAKGVISEFDVPGAGAATGGGAGTYSSAINLFGTIIGWTYDPNFVAGRGFVRFSDGRITAFTVPGAPSTGTYTQPWCINLAGEFTGTYYDVNGNAHGFVALVRQ
jgi:hypothetical protein